MTKPVVKCCNSCKWGCFWRTPTGKPKRGHAGRCMVDVDLIGIQRFLREHLPSCVPVEISYVRHGLQPDDGAFCFLWEGK